MADNGLASTRPALSAQYEARQNLPFSERVHPALPVEPLAPAYDPDLEGTGGDEQQDRRDVDGEADEQRHLRSTCGFFRFYRRATVTLNVILKLGAGADEHHTHSFCTFISFLKFLRVN